MTDTLQEINEAFEYLIGSDLDLARYSSAASTYDTYTNTQTELAWRCFLAGWRRLAVDKLKQETKERKEFLKQWRQNIDKKRVVAA